MVPIPSPDPAPGGHGAAEPSGVQVYRNGRACALTDRGRVRERNEDAFALSWTDPAVLVVADGMGGHPAGEVASRIAAGTALQWLTGGPGPTQGPNAEPQAGLPAVSYQAADGPPQGQGAGPVVGREGASPGAPSAAPLEAAVRAAHRAVLDATELRPEWRGMGTALTVARISGERLDTCHVGDVRVYLFRDGALLQLTSDHSAAAELLRRGALTATQARGHHLRHRLSQALGEHGSIEPESHRVRLVPGDAVVLCSDGLWEAVSDGEMGILLGEPVPLERRVASLVDAANRAGGRDNITALVYEYRPGS
ncbi:MAG: protein phosphatase 2C domain-containing protein [Candidatus Latescibacterota bacterium]